MSESTEAWIEKMVNTHGLDPEDILEIAELFFDTIEETIEELKICHSKSDMNGIARVAHGIKGSALNIGFQEIGEQSRQMEEFSQGKTQDSFEELLHSIIVMIEKRKQSIENVSF